MMKKKWTLYLIHHSHTDIGYTDRQEKIERYHIDFIQQAIDILNQIHGGPHSERKGFKWNCENFWQVERFLEYADLKTIDDFHKYVMSGEIDISGNYLNMTELIDYNILSKKLKESVSYFEKLGKQVSCSMTADINGYSWGYADALYENGITNLFSCVHTHHGMFPIYKKQIPFWWETPKKNKILVWNGEHYHIGNELVLVPNGGSTYLIGDEFASKVHHGQEEVREKRIYRYLENLENENYPFSFVPVMVSGVISDNAPPNSKIMDVVNNWNELHGHEIELKMVTLHEFFSKLHQHTENIPVYSGDWNDWWADGVGSTPAAVKHFRGAQTKYRLCRKLDPDGTLGNNDLVKKAEHNLMLYAEHTWGYATSVSEPWNTLVNELDFRKTAFATLGNEAISRNIDLILAKKGEVSIYPDREKLYKIINPHQYEINDIAKIHLKYWEYLDNKYIENNNFDECIEIIDVQTGKILESQTHMSSQGREIEILVSLLPNEEKLVKICRRKRNLIKTVKNDALIGADGIEDIALTNCKDHFHLSHLNLETPFYKVSFNEQKGIGSIIYKPDQKELIRTDSDHPFIGVYERTDIERSPTDERRRMGRNRKSISTKRYRSSLNNITILEKGKLYCTFLLDFNLEGTKLYSVFLKIYRNIPKIDVNVRIHKTSHWEPENLYISLPFTTGEQEELFIEKTGCIIRPGIDQLPGTNKDFYLLQNGMAYVSQTKGLVLVIKDTPLIAIGDLHYHAIELSQNNDCNHNLKPVYSWVMNNFWETNFKVDLSGFYEFEYTIFTSDKLNSKEDAIETCKQLNEGLLAFMCDG
jgi:hypothetical protein